MDTTDVEPLSLGQVSALLGVSKLTVNRLQRDPEDPLPVKNPGGGRGNRVEYDPQAVGKWLKRRWSKSALDVNAEKARNLSLDSRLKQLKIDRETGVLIPSEIVERVWAGMTGNARQRLLNLPYSLAVGVEGQPFAIMGL